MSAVLIIHAHPYPRRSLAGKALLEAVQDIEGVSVRSLYDRYPDFAIDVADEQRALLEASTIVWQTPFYWYGVPSLMQHWFEKVLEHGWSHGPDGDAIAGKSLIWVCTTGTPASAYRTDAMHGHPFPAFVHPIEQTARFCGLIWEEPIVLHGAHQVDEAELERLKAVYRSRVESAVKAHAAKEANVS